MEVSKGVALCSAGQQREGTTSLDPGALIRLGAGAEERDLDPLPSILTITSPPARSQQGAAHPSHQDPQGNSTGGSGDLLIQQLLCSTFGQKKGLKFPY